MDLHPLDVALKLAIEGEADWSERILRDQPQNDPRVAFNLGWHELRHGNLYKGMDLLNAGRVLNVFGSPPLPTSAPIWRGPDPKIIFRLEGGLGDHIMNVRFAKNIAKHGEVTVLTHPSLVEMCKSVEGVTHCLPDTITELPPHDYWLPAMSAPYVLRMEYSDLSGKPYIPQPTPRKLYGKFKVGLRWSGNPQFEHQQHRKFDPQLMINLSKIDGICFYSLQRDYDLVDIPFVDFRNEMNTWEDTASILAGLDLLITSDTSVAHLSAAMGIPTWIITPVLPYYPWALPGDKTPWYDSVKLFRQTTYGDWNTPFKQIEIELNTIKNQYT